MSDTDTTADWPTVRLGVSGCLLGEQVRFDGGHKHDRFLTGKLGPYVKWVSVCPEVEVGMGTPRETIRLVGDPANPDLVAPRSGTDHTESMTRWSEKRTEELAGDRLDGYVLKKGSPSCGLYRLPVYDPRGGAPSRTGRGIFARVLADRFATLPIEEEGRLNDPALRENFIARIFTRARWRQMLAGGRAPKALVEFHASHKYLFLAHAPEKTRDLGRLVADAGSADWDSLTDEYRRGMAACMARPASRGRHVNVIQHLAGFIKEAADAEDRAELGRVLAAYRRREVPLNVPLVLLRHLMRRLRADQWATSQVYLSPYPDDLMLRNAV